jgi:hypothetical protein
VVEGDLVSSGRDRRRGGSGWFAKGVEKRVRDGVETVF